jgi:hypothetical protein
MTQQAPLVFALAVIETPDYARHRGAGPYLAIFWKQEVQDARPGVSFSFYDCMGTDGEGRAFKVRIARDVIEKAFREPKYFIETLGVRGPTIGFTGHEDLLKGR